MNADPMPMENEEPSSPESVAAPANTQAPAPVPSQPAFDPRRRIRELMSIPERDRTDAEWDELNELEIQTAPGNRAGGQQPYGYSGKPGGGGGGGSGSGGGGMSKNRFKTKPRKPGGGPNPGNPGGGRPNQPRPNKPPRPA